MWPSMPLAIDYIGRSLLHPFTFMATPPCSDPPPGLLTHESLKLLLGTLWLLWPHKKYCPTEFFNREKSDDIWGYLWHRDNDWDKNVIWCDCSVLWTLAHGTGDKEKAPVTLLSRLLLPPKERGMYRYLLAAQLLKCHKLGNFYPWADSTFPPLLIVNLDWMMNMFRFW